MLAAIAPQQQFPTPPTAQHPVFRAGATLVAVDVYPTKDGKIVEGLTPADFDVKEDGKPQTLEFFEFLKFEQQPIDSERIDPTTAEDGERLAADPHHRAFIAFFDTYHLTTVGARNMRTPVTDFFNRTIGNTDYFAAMNPDTLVAAITFGQRTETISNEIDRYWPLTATSDARTIPMSPQEEWLAGCYQYRWPDVSRDQALVAQILTRWRMSLVLTSLNGLVAKLGTIREERTNVLLFADGWSLGGADNTLTANEWNIHSQPGVANGRFTPNGANKMTPDTDKCDAELARLAGTSFDDAFRVLREEALKKNVAFNTISPGGLAALDDRLMLSQGRPPSYNESVATLDTLRTLASATNGQSIVETNDIRTPMRQLADAVSSYYLVGYYTTNAKLDNKYRTIDVKVKTPGVHVTARHGYVANANPVVTRTVDGAAGEPSAEAAALGTLAVLDSPQSLFASAVPSGSDLAVVVEVLAARASDFDKGASVTVTVSGAVGSAPVTASGPLAVGARSALVRVPLGGMAGPWQVRVALGSPPAGLSTSIAIPQPATPLVSDPIVYRATPSSRSPLWPSATRVFSRNDRVHLEWSTSGPLDTRVGRLLDRRGQGTAVAVNLSEPPNAERPTLAGDVSLAPLAPGDYLIELVVGRGGATERHLVAIRVGS